MKVTPKQYIGGDFDLPRLTPKAQTEASRLNWGRRAKYLYSAGRFAMVAALEFAHDCGEKILIPDYLCEAQVQILKSRSVPFVFYRVGDNLLPISESIAQAAKGSSRVAVLAIDYFGLLDLSDAAEQIRVARPEARLMADCVQAPFDLPVTNDFDFIYTSFRKFVPVMDGAELITNQEIRSKPCRSPAGFVSEKLEAGVLKAQYLSSDIVDPECETKYLRKFIEGEESLERDSELTSMSQESVDRLSCLDLSEVSRQRRANFNFLSQKLSSIGIQLPEVSDKTPLCVPLWINDRDHVRAKLREHGIFAPAHWPAFKDLPDGLGQNLARHELGLVIDHRYDETDMDRQAEALKEVLDQKPQLTVCSLLQRIK